MSDDGGVRLDFEVNLGSSSRNLNALERQLASAERALNDARNAADDLEARLNRVSGGVNVDIAIDDSALRNAAGIIEELDSSTTINVNVNDNDLRTAVSDKNELNGTTTLTANVNDRELTSAARSAEDLNTTTTLTANVNDRELTTAINNAGDLNGSTTLTVNVNDQDVTRLLEQIRALSVVDVGLNVAGAATGLAGGAAGFIGNVTGVTEMVETNAALVELQYTTGQLLPQAEELADALFLANWGENRAQLLDYIGTATILGVEFEDMESAITAAFQSSAITGFEMEETLRAQQSLVKNGLVPDFQTAGTVISAAFQSGANVGDDLLDTINEYGSTFAAMGFTTEQVLSTLNSGLAAGADNTDRIADAVREFGIRAREGTDEFKAAIEQLDLTEVYDSFLAGETTGADFFGQLTENLGQVKDLAQQTAAATATIGTQSEDFTVDVIANIDVNQDQLQAIETATESMDLVGSDLESQIEEFSRFIETKLHDAFREGFNIEEFIDNAKNSIDAFFTTLENGGSLGDALGVAIDVLNIPILEDFQQTLSQLAIGFLQAAREIIGLLPGNQGESSLDNLIQQLGTGQFEIDIAVADDSQAIIDSVQTAIDRGVDYQVIANQINTAFEGAMSDVDLEELLNLQAAMATFEESQQGNLHLALDPDQAATQIREAYASAFQMAAESGDIGKAFDLAAAIGDQEQISQLSELITTTFTDALMDGQLDVAASVSDAIPGVIEELQAQLDAAQSDPNSDISVATFERLTEQITLLEDSLAFFDELDYTPPIDEEDAAAAEAVNETIANSTEESTERQVKSVIGHKEAVEESARSTTSAEQNASKAIVDAKKNVGVAADKMGAQVTTAMNTATIALRNFRATADSETNVVIADFQRMDAQTNIYITQMTQRLTALGAAMAGLPTLPAIPGVPTTPTPTGSGNTGTPTPTPAPMPVADALGMASAFAKMGAVSGDVSVNNVNNFIFNTQSGAGDMNGLLQASKVMRSGAYG